MDIKILDIVNQIKSGKIKNIIILSGSGISTNTGIPDFRSQGGLYNTLKPHLLTATSQEKQKLALDPTMVVHYDMFKNNPFPYLEVRRPFILGTYEKRWLPSIAHFFFKLLEDKKILSRVYTQNIDGLDHLTGLDKNNIINVHGSLSEINCEFCKESYPYKQFVEYVRTNIKDIYDPNDKTTSTKLLCTCCGKAGLKPNTVMYGKPLSSHVLQNAEIDFPKADLLIITGTSLTVHPACDFINKVNKSIPRLVINNKYVGEDLGLNFTHKSRDSIMLGDIDFNFLQLVYKLGWIDDFVQYKELMCENSQEQIKDCILTSINLGLDMHLYKYT